MNRYNASTAGSSNNNNMAISARTSQGSVAYTEKTIEANCAVTLLLDVSGSMSGAPIRALVAEVRRLVPLLPEHTPLTIWTFNDYVKKLTHTKVRLHSGTRTVYCTVCTMRQLLHSCHRPWISRPC